MKDRYTIKTFLNRWRDNISYVSFLVGLVTLLLVAKMDIFQTIMIGAVTFTSSILYTIWDYKRLMPGEWGRQTKLNPETMEILKNTRKIIDEIKKKKKERQPTSSALLAAEDGGYG